MKEKTLFKWEQKKSAVITMIIAYCIVPFFIPLAFFVVPMLLHSAEKILVTDKRVYLKTIAGRCSELPMNQVSMITKAFWGGKLVISTAAGHIGVWMFSYRDKVFDMLSKCIIDQQNTVPVSEEVELPQL